MVVHVWKERFDNITLIDVANEFIKRADSRRQIFGKFSNWDSSREITIAHKSQTSIGDRIAVVRREDTFDMIVYGILSSFAILVRSIRFKLLIQ